MNLRRFGLILSATVACTTVQAGIAIHDPFFDATQCDQQLQEAAPTARRLMLNVESAINLSGRGVFKIQDESNGKQYILRFQSKNDLNSRWRDVPLTTSSPDFEYFATTIAKKVSDRVRIVTVEKLSARDSKVLYEALKLKGGWKADLEKNSTPLATLAPFEEGESVLKVFPLAHQSSYMAAFMSMLTGMSRGYEPDANFRVAATWMSEAIAEAAKRGENDTKLSQYLSLLQELFPGQKFENRANFERLFFGNMPLIHDLSNVERCFIVMLSKLPPDYLDGVAEYWAIGNILGIPDLDAANALWDGKKLIGIDLAYKSSRFLAGYLYPNNGEQTVALDLDTEFSEIYSPLLGKLLMSRLRPQFILNLSKIKTDDIRAIAKKAGLAMTQRQLDGMMSRIQHFITKDLGVGKKEVVP